MHVSRSPNLEGDVRDNWVGRLKDKGDVLKPIALLLRTDRSLGSSFGV